MNRRMTAACAAVLFLAGCASQKPVLYSASDNAPAGGDQAIAACQQRAEAAGLDYEKGRVGGYARGAVENGAMRSICSGYATSAPTRMPASPSHLEKLTTVTAPSG